MVAPGKWRICVGLGALAALVGMAGCNDAGRTQIGEKPTNASPPVASIPNGAAPPSGIAANLDPKLHQPFEQACITEIDANVGVDLPPAQTLSGKNTGGLNDQIHKIWDTIKFVAADGKPITYVAELHLVAGDQDLGTIEILMRPDIAPNHVRNFVALATLEYYDGLRFDRIVRQSGAGENDTTNKLLLLEAGSPTEDADPASSHLGYWLKPEFNETAKHEEGSVGACLLESDDNIETAAVRFYLSLTPAPAMDGNFTIFGKVNKGLEVAKRLAELPVHSSQPGPDDGKPVKPIVIKKVHIRTVPVQ